MTIHKGRSEKFGILVQLTRKHFMDLELALLTG